VVYEDPQLGFCILAHRYTDARNGPPHDHGPSWAIYGQADGETVMSDWAVVEPARDGGRAKVKKLRDYTLTPAPRMSTTRATCTHRAGRDPRD
jgi:hypothetical protein